MLDAHAYVMQVKLCKANTRGVTPDIFDRITSYTETNATLWTMIRDFLEKSPGGHFC